ncbi:MAG: butyrate kinase [Clostridiales bacterium]|nr:butyrate kinase [Clostridiales bacterium]
MIFRILAVNPGSTSTKIAVYENDAPLFESTVRHDAGGDASLAVRERMILDALAEYEVAVESLHAIIGRGGMLRPIPGGVYPVNEAMLRDLRNCVYGDHASNLGAQLARRMAEPLGIPAYIADPVVTDELSPLARLSGHPQIARRSVFHALNQRAVAKRFCAARGLHYEDVNLIVAHMGGGVTVGAHQYGRVVDVNDGLGGDGPYSAQRCGGLPAFGLLKLYDTEKLTPAQMAKKLTSDGGLLGYLGTDDGLEVSRRAQEGDKAARIVYEGMAYQVAKEIGACAAVLSGEVAAIILTGGFARDEELVGWIAERVRFIAEILVIPGEDELRALSEAALRALRGEETLMAY